MQPGIVGPENFPIRDPRDTKMSVGRIANPPRMIEIGGLDAQNKWNKEIAAGGQSPQTHIAPVEKPTNVKGAKKTSDYDI